MINSEQQRRQPHSHLTIITIGLMLLIGAIIIFLDRNQVRQLPGKAEWNYLGVALGFVFISYLAQSSAMVVMLRVFGVKGGRFYLLRLGLVSSVLSNLVAMPAALALQLVVLGRRGAKQSEIIGSSLLLSFCKNLVFYTLIPVSLIYVIFTYPLAFGGVAVMVLISVILVAAISVATIVVLNSRVRLVVLKLLGRVWHFVTHRNIETTLTNFGNAVSQGIMELKRKPKLGILLAAIVIGDVAAMIAALAFCFKALGIPVHLGVLVTGFNFGITLTVISFIPGDIGVQEASIAGILVIFGVPFSQGVLAAILFRVLYYFVPFILSLGLYWSILRETREKAGEGGVISKK